MSERLLQHFHLIQDTAIARMGVFKRAGGAQGLDLSFCKRFSPEADSGLPLFRLGMSLSEIQLKTLK
jgi:hypothetical protein